MAVTKASITEVELGMAQIERFEPLLGEQAWKGFQNAMNAFARDLRGRRIWNVNSTTRGGGVAELLASLIPYARGCGIDERWLVIEGSPDFFDVTKKIHTLLHGVVSDSAAFTDRERSVYEETLTKNGTALVGMLQPGDVAFLQDPQTAGLIPRLKERGVRVIWRSHVGIDEPNDAARLAWRFLLPYVTQAHAFVFSRQAHVWEGLDRSQVHIIPPCIDPFTPKNQDLDERARDAILQACGIFDGAGKDAGFTRQDGSRGQVKGTVTTGAPALPHDARIVLQVSRWDRLKDPAGVMEAFVRHIAPRVDSWLVLAGPAATSVRDDPEQPEIIDDLVRRRDRLAGPLRQRVLIAQLPMQDADENAAIVNALQRRADVVVQKSLAEGFGLTVAEAMWKARPVVASQVGGIEDQVEDGLSGVLVDDPRDLQACGQAVVGLLLDAARSAALGQHARRRVIERFIAPRHLVDEANLIEAVLG